jgi:homoserine kinase
VALSAQRSFLVVSSELALALLAPSWTSGTEQARFVMPHRCRRIDRTASPSFTGLVPLLLS